jgi:hypothetical protein
VRIGFLYNHEAPHQIAHTAPVAAELARRDGVTVTVLTTSAEQEARARALIGPAAARIRFVHLSIGPLARAADAGLRWIVPFRRIAMLRENLPRFAELDVLVVPETTSLLLRDRFGLSDLKLVWIPHGAGDRSVGFRPVIRGFDLVLLSGPKVRDRMVAQGLITPENHAIIGYPKFDTVEPQSPLPPLFANGRPTVLYNPHFDPRLSSWYTLGEPVIRWFADQDRFNLVVAPHVMLFRRRFHASVEHRRVRWRGDVPRIAARHILIDTGSARSVDMSYTRAADIYLGDASSQVYEWIARPRPAIFLNPGRFDWANDPSFAHWHLGDVIDTAAALPAGLDRAVTRPDRYAASQAHAFAQTFGSLGGGASRRAADAILARYGSR